MSPVQAAVKRAIDVVVSFVGLVVLSPLLLLIALAVRLTSPGSALFRQRRLGKDGVPFTIHKFRSMFVNAPDIRNPDGSTFNAENDPRLTPLGRFLRKASLDELPQLINVLKGDMCLVGPRPDQVDQLQYYTAEDKRKLLVKPGITGPTQISGRNSIPWKHRRKIEVQYVENYSLWQDLQILLRTVPVVLGQEGVFINNLVSAEQSKDTYTKKEE